MSETPKFFKMIKTTPNDVIMILHPLSNMDQSKTVHLTQRNPFQMLPADWALGIFMSDENFKLYEQGIITFEDNDTLVQAAYDAGAYFSATLDFTPATSDHTADILAVLQAGNRQKILDAIEKYGKDQVKNVAISQTDKLTTGVLGMLENIFHVQLILDGGLN